MAYMTPATRQISENVVVLMHRLGINNKELADEIGMSRVPLGNRILGETEWRAYEVDAVARALGVTPTELMSTIPTFKEWDRRRAEATTEIGIRATGGPRFLVMPEEAFDYLTPPSRLGKPASDIMSDYIDGRPSPELRRPTTAEQMRSRSLR